MPDESPEKKRPLANLARILIGAGLPALGTAIGGPVGGVIAGTVARRLGLDETSPEQAIEEKLAANDPATLVELRKVEAQMLDAQVRALEVQEEAVTARHATDMAGDSWLAKNVRPAGFALILCAFVVYAFIVTFFLPSDRFTSAEYFGGLLEGILGMYLSFYVVTRSAEKLTGMFKGGGQG